MLTEGRGLDNDVRCLLKPFYSTHVGKGGGVFGRWTSPVVGALVPGGRRKGRADELFPVAVGGVVPGVGLDDELLPSQAQATPAGQKASQERWR